MFCAEVQPGLRHMQKETLLVLDAHWRLFIRKKKKTVWFKKKKKLVQGRKKKSKKNVWPAGDIKENEFLQVGLLFNKESSWSCSIYIASLDIYFNMMHAPQIKTVQSFLGL